MNKTLKIGLVLLLLLIPMVCLCLCVWLYFPIMSQCYPWNCAPKRDFDVLNMGIPGSYYPSTIEMSEFSEFDFDSTYTDANNASMEAICQNHIVYTITRFTEIKFAEKDFHAQILYNENFFLESDPVTVYRPQYASEFFYQCGEYDSFGYRCKFVARYEEFVITYITQADDGVKQVDTVVQYLDERMGKLINGEEVKPWQEIKGPYWKEREEAE